MTKAEMQTLFALAEKLYWQEQKKSGMGTPMPYALAMNGGEKLIAVSMFGIHTDNMKAKLRELR